MAAVKVPEQLKFVAVSSTSIKYFQTDAARPGAPAPPAWQYSGSQVQSSVQFMKKGAFISGSGVQVLCNLPEAPTAEKKDLTVARHNLLSLPQGPLLLRISGDGKALCVVQAPVPGQLQIFDLQALLAQVGKRGNSGLPWGWGSGVGPEAEHRSGRTSQARLKLGLAWVPRLLRVDARSRPRTYFNMPLSLRTASEPASAEGRADASRPRPPHRCACIVQLHQPRGVIQVRPLTTQPLSPSACSSPTLLGMVTQHPIPK